MPTNSWSLFGRSPEVKKRLAVFLACSTGLLILGAGIFIFEFHGFRSDSALSPQRLETRNLKDATSNSSSSLIHDFGIIPPRAIRSCTFIIANPTTSPWRILGLERTCSCTSATIDKPEIPAGGHARVLVEYRASQRAGDVSTKLNVAIEGQRAGFCALTIKAKVREAVTAVPRSVNLHYVAGTPAGNTSPENAAFVVSNFSEQHWDDLRVENVPAWLTVNRIKLPDSTGRDSSAPKQSWRIFVRPSHQSKSLPCTVHSASLYAHPVLHGAMGRNIDDAESGQYLGVRLYKTGLLHVAPIELFLGRVRCRVPVRSTIRITADKALVNVTRTDTLPVVEHDLGHYFHFEVVRSSPLAWEVRTELTPEVPPRPIHGTIVIRFSTNEESVARVKVYAIPFLGREDAAHDS